MQIKGLGKIGLIILISLGAILVLGLMGVFNNVVNTFKCPTGYISVPGNTTLNTKDFCVMKYEAKAVDNKNIKIGLTEPNTGVNTIDNNKLSTTAENNRSVASLANGYPITNISQTDAINYCNGIGASLITNKDWMTIARNIEAQGKNWTGGKIGEGGLWRGHSDAIPNKALEAGTDKDPYFGTENKEPKSIEKRTHTLSNGQIIWDISGNVWEWTNDTIQAVDQPKAKEGEGDLISGADIGNIIVKVVTDAITKSIGIIAGLLGGNVGSPIIGDGQGVDEDFRWREFSNITDYGVLGYDFYSPSNKTWNSAQNMGKIAITGKILNNETTYAIRRGKDWNGGDKTGIYSMYIHDAPTHKGDDTGFRCVIH